MSSAAASSQLAFQNAAYAATNQQVNSTIVSQEKHPGYVVGESVLGPLLNKVGALAKGLFNVLGSGFRSLDKAVRSFEILPTVGAAKTSDPDPTCSTQSEDLPQDLERITNVIKKSKAPAKEEYHEQGVIYQKLGRYKDARTAFKAALKIDDHFSSAQEGLNKVAGFLKNPQDPKYRADFLEEIGFNQPSHYAYLSMGSLVYEDIQSDNLNELDLSTLKYALKSNEALAKDLASKGWKLAKVKKVKKSGYVGMAFIHEKQGTIVLAHKGTKITSTKDLENCVEVAGSGIPTQYQDAEEFAQEIAATYPKCTLSHGGHSLGAVLAELLAYDRKEVAVTAESPGILSMISKEYFEQGGASVPIVSYLSTPNIVNTCNAHIGTLRAVNVPPSVSSTGLLDSVVTGIKEYVSPGAAKIAAVATALAEDLNSHKLDRLIKEFSPKKGEASYKLITKWPKGVQERLEFAKLCGKNCNPSNLDSFSSKSHAISEVYQVEKATARRIKLNEFSKEAREFLLGLRTKEQIPVDLNSRILSLYFVQGDEVYVKGEDALFTVQDFHSYIESQLAYHRKKVSEGSGETKENPFNACCKLNPPNNQGEVSENAQASTDLFFSLPSVQNLGAFGKEKMETYIKKAEEENLEAYLRLHLGEDFEELIETELSNVKDAHLKMLNPDFTSMTDHIFSSQAHLKFLSVMHESKRFFIGKDLMINANGVIMHGEIKNFTASCRDLHFHFKGGEQAVIHLDDKCGVDGVTCTRDVDRPLLSRLMEEPIGSEFDLVVSELADVPEWVQAGHYRLLDREKFENSECIKIGIDGEATYDIEISYDEEGGVKRVRFVLSKDPLKHFDETFQIKAYFKASRKEEEWSSLSEDNINEVVILQKSFIDAHQEALKKIDALNLKLVEAIKKDDTYLTDLMEHMIDQQFKAPTDPTLIEGKRIAPFEPLLKNLVELIKADGDPALSSYPAILQAAVIEANYQRFAPSASEDSFSLSEAMHLFAQSDQFTQKMKDKELILFIGKTGAGKSTSIAAFVGCKLKKARNSLGDDIFKLRSEGEEGCPKIGQSYTTSETVFAQSFAIRERDGLELGGNQNIRLADTPGLGDTRGKKYALCAALSIDQAIKQAKSVKALVIAIPLSAFTTNRGNEVIDLMRELKDFFPGVLEEGSNSVHILVTRHGRRKKIDLVRLTSDFLAQDKNENRRSIWSALLSMATNDQMVNALPNGANPSRKQLNKYVSSKGIEPKKFNTLMDTPMMQRDFADFIQKAARTWSEGVFGRYLNYFSQEQVNIEKIAKHEKNLKEAQKQLISINKAITVVKDGVLSKREIADKISLTCQEGIEIYRKREVEADDEIKAFEAEVAKIKVEVLRLSQEIEKHSSGREVEPLYNLSYAPDQVVTFCSLKEGKRDDAHREGRATNETDCINGGYDQKVLAKDYVGTFAQSVEISKGYSLVPSDDSKRKEFEKYGIVQTDEGRYKAIVSGSHYELDLERRADTGRNKIVYYFKTDWKEGRDLPTLKIDHEVPRIVYYSVSLTGWHGDKVNLENEQKRIEKAIGDSQKWKKEQQEKIGQKISDELEQQQRYFDSQVVDSRRDIDAASQRIRENKKERVMVAATIKTHWQVATSLSDFTAEVMKNERKRSKTSAISVDKGLIATCKAYQQIFNNKGEGILANCTRDLGVSCGVIELRQRKEMDKEERFMDRVKGAFGW